MKLGFQQQRGTAIVEFAIVLPLLLILIIGIVEFGFIFYDQAMVTNASREGARTGIVFNTDGNGNFSPVSDSTIADRVETYLLDNLISLGDSTAQFSLDPAPQRVPNPSTGQLSPGGTLTVTVRYPYTFLVLPRFVADVTGQINLTARTVMRFE